MSEACAKILARDDPHLHATALFAKEPARSRLMVLYAFDCELSRAIRASSESLIPRMRLQWWRDAIHGANAGEPPKQHEVAAPLADVIRTWREHDAPLGSSFETMIYGYERELDGLPDIAALEAWAEQRFGMRTSLAQSLTDGPEARPEMRLYEYNKAAGLVLGTAFALRTASAMVARGHRALLPGLSGAESSALGRGATTEAARSVAQDLAATARGALARLRADRSAWRRENTPVLLPLMRAERVLRLASRPMADFRHFEQIDRAFDGFRLAWRAATGRW